jgi:uncharacterized protein YggE
MLFRVVLTLLVLGAAPASAQEPTQPRITVTGEASISVEPDVAQLRAGVVTDAKTAREAAEANSRTMNAVMAAVRALGIAERDVQTSRYSIQPTYEPARPQRDRISGFQATNSVTLKIRQIDKLGEIIDRLAVAGANSMGGVEFLVSDPSKQLDEARKQAIADARRRAELYASAAGVALGGVFSITEQSVGMPFPPMPMGRAAAAPETPIAPGERTLRLAVTVTFDLRR